jgi:hypothetical protein
MIFLLSVYPSYQLFNVNETIFKKPSVYIYIYWQFSPFQRFTSSICVCLCIPQSLLGNGSVKNKSPLQRKHTQ